MASNASTPLSIPDTSAQGASNHSTNSNANNIANNIANSGRPGGLRPSPQRVIDQHGLSPTAALARGASKVSSSSNSSQVHTPAVGPSTPASTSSLPANPNGSARHTHTTPVSRVSSNTSLANLAAIAGGLSPGSSFRLDSPQQQPHPQQHPQQQHSTSVRGHQNQQQLPYRHQPQWANTRAARIAHTDDMPRSPQDTCHARAEQPAPSASAALLEAFRGQLGGNPAARRSSSTTTSTTAAAAIKRPSDPFDELASMSIQGIWQQWFTPSSQGDSGGGGGGGGSSSNGGDTNTGGGTGDGNRDASSSSAAHARMPTPLQQPRHQHQPQQSRQSHQQQPQQADDERDSQLEMVKCVLNMWLAGLLPRAGLPLLQHACEHVLEHVCGQQRRMSVSTLQQDAQRRLHNTPADALKAMFTVMQQQQQQQQQQQNQQKQQASSSSSSSSLVGTAPALAGTTSSASMAAPSSSLSSVFNAAVSGMSTTAPVPPTSSGNHPARSAADPQHHHHHHHHHQQHQQYPGRMSRPELRLRNHNQHVAAPDVSAAPASGGGGQLSSLFGTRRPPASQLELPAMPDTTLTDSFHPVALSDFGDFDMADLVGLNDTGTPPQPPDAHSIGGGGSSSVMADLQHQQHQQHQQLGSGRPGGDPRHLRGARWTDTETLGMGINRDVQDMMFDSSNLPWENTLSASSQPQQQQQPQQQPQQELLLRQQQSLLRHAEGTRTTYNFAASVQQESQSSSAADAFAMRGWSDLQRLRAQRNSSSGSHLSDDAKATKKPKVTCPVCGGPGRDTEARICGLCYNGVYNDIKKYLKREHTLDASVLVDADRFIHELQVMPRGCDKNYSCTKEDYAYEKPQYEKCTRCRSLAVTRAAPELVLQMIRKQLDKEARRREQDAQYKADPSA
ncbi:hypothetical protein PTSG_02264 [Salpingoeca rosetta]|uniref:Uncharacterized protein n=1 Tax=Salpingoeca rosetta (strain ATCC 50818 / BSB-021) TaxID=946362 RepID=F2U1P3_SALR5|nr:uncharacterized protein PTSG_02264 [Salpingoeca rosetta]EGD81545.1 hypothetical protein PTSG_02264 [Salpingoeca rosetta]|eukprot:XP_004996749.1 hypothetical protein PTSG_02264 [Salpingoeca rosetta]